MKYQTRAEWGARPPSGQQQLSRSEGIFLHYRGPGGAPDNVPAEQRALRQDQSYHMDTKGWSDIAYSWAVGNTGTIYELRGWGVQGGHTQGWNSRSHAVLWIGGDEGVPSRAALDSIGVVVDEHRKRYGGFVKGHRDVNSTSCPGDALYGHLRAGHFDPAPIYQEEDEDVSKVLLRDKNGKVWLAQGITKVHVPSPEHADLLKFLGAEDKTQADSTKLLETLGTLPNGV